jgi:hypothetical protein
MFLPLISVFGFIGFVHCTVPGADVPAAVDARQPRWRERCPVRDLSYLIPKGLNEGSQAVYCLGCDLATIRPAGNGMIDSPLAIPIPALFKYRRLSQRLYLMAYHGINRIAPYPTGRIFLFRHRRQ